jgi:predicted dehydrogenase
MIRVGVIGYGYWGPGIVRNFHNVEGCEVAMVCDTSPAALKRAKQAYPSVEVTTDPCDVLSSANIDAFRACQERA